MRRKFRNRADASAAHLAAAEVNMYAAAHLKTRWCNGAGANSQNTGENGASERLVLYFVSQLPNA